VTDCEKSDFVKTPRFAETMAWFEKLADYSSMVNVTSFGKSALTDVVCMSIFIP
jgi:glycine cleavage system H lipoate-binding protein